MSKLLLFTKFLIGTKKGLIEKWKKENEKVKNYYYRKTKQGKMLVFVTVSFNPQVEVKKNG